MCYVGFGGDVEKTAIASHIPAKIVRSLEHDFDWEIKLKRMRNGGGDDDVERVANRAVNYLQAQRMRDVLETTLTLISGDREELVRLVSKVHVLKDGSVDYVEVSPKAVLELTKALESVHNMLYRALGDKVATAAEAVAKAEGAGATSAGNLDNVRNIIESLSIYVNQTRVDEQEAKPASEAVGTTVDVETQSAEGCDVDGRQGVRLAEEVQSGVQAPQAPAS